MSYPSSAHSAVSTDLKILVVDDEQVMLDVVVEAVSTLKYFKHESIFTAKNGKEGLELFFEHHPDIVISDIMMPVMNGSQMVEKIRLGDDPTEIITMSGYADFDMALTLIKHNVQDFLRKPFRMQELLNVIKNTANRLLEKRQVESMRRKLIDSEKLASIGLLAAGVAHEINNPNTFVKGNLELLSKFFTLLKPTLELSFNEHAANEQVLAAFNNVEKTLGSAIQGTERIRNITQALLNLGRNTQSTIVSIDLKKAIEAALLIVSFRTKKHEVVCDFPEKLKPIEGIEQQLVQVIMNLTVNAVDAIEEFMPGKKGRITFIIRENAGTTILVIKDNGKGMDAETQASIFKPFFTTKKEGKGTGLGLSIVARVVTSIGGKISCTSEPGKGTEFMLELRQSPPH